MYGIHPWEFNKLTFPLPLQLSRSSFEKIELISSAASSIIGSLALTYGSFQISLPVILSLSAALPGTELIIIPLEMYFLSKALETGAYLGKSIGLSFTNRFVCPID